MRKIEVSPDHPGRDYAEHCLVNGHEPGVLSGADLEGKAKYYGAGYARSRANLSAWLDANFGVRSELALIRVTGSVRRWCRVWVDHDGNPVRLVVSD